MANLAVVAIRLDDETRRQVEVLARALDVKPTVLMRRMIENQTHAFHQLAETQGSAR